MNIWMLTTEYPPFYGGGIATYCYHTVCMLAQNGHNITVFVHDHNIEEQTVITTDKNIRIIRFKSGSGEYCRYLGYFAALSYCYSEIVENYIKREGAPDIIECQDYLGIGYFLLQKKKTLWPGLKEAPVLLTLHTPKFICDRVDRTPEYKFPDYWIGEMERFAMCASDALVSPSEYLLKTLVNDFNIANVDCHVVPHPYYSTEDFGKETVNRCADKNDIVFLGRVQYLKGIEHVLKYFKDMWDSGFDLPLKIIGGDTYFHPKGKMMGDYLREKFKYYYEHGLVIFEGLYAPDELQKRLGRAHMIVVPSLFESFSYSVVECLSLGKLTLASTSGGQREIIEHDGASGFLFSHDSPEDFSKQVTRILSLADDEITAVGERSKCRIEELCSYTRVYNKKMEIIHDTIRKEKNSRRFPFIRGPEKNSLNNLEKICDSKEKPGLLSIIIPYYNMGAYIRDTVDSLVAVDYPYREIIIINDGSDSAESLAVLYDVESNYPVRVVHKRNAGLAAARNTGAGEAAGEFIAFIDADDMVQPEYYSWAIKLLDFYNNISFVGCWTKYFEGTQGIWPTWNPEPPYFLVHNTLNTSGLVYRKKDFIQCGMNDPEMEYGMEDYECALRMVKEGCRGIVIPEPFFKYRVRADSMSRQFNRGNLLYLYYLITAKHKDFYAQYAKDVFNLLNNNGPAYLYDNPTWDLPPVGYLNRDDNS